jgi:hypothetical protein
MSKKIDKLKEVNATLDRILIQMETHIFVENINVEENKKLKELKAEVDIELK